MKADLTKYPPLWAAYFWKKNNENSVKKLAPFQGILMFSRKSPGFCLKQEKFGQHHYILYLRNILAKIILQFSSHQISALNCVKISHFSLYLCLSACT